MAQAVDALGYIHPVAVGQCCAAWSWSIGATSLARLAIMMMMNLGLQSLHFQCVLQQKEGLKQISRA